MFSIFKQASNEEVVLQELSEGQLTSVAGGYGSHWKHEHHKSHQQHHHKHTHHMMHHKWSSHTKKSMSHTTPMKWGGHW